MHLSFRFFAGVLIKTYFTDIQISKVFNIKHHQSPLKIFMINSYRENGGQQPILYNKGLFL